MQTHAAQVRATWRAGVRRAWPAALTVAVALGGLSACAPALDWREVRPEGTSAVFMFPCKPSSHARELVLADRPTKLTLYACQADGATWAVAFTDMADPRLTTAALEALRVSAQRNLGAAGARARPGQVAGATPNAQAGRLDIEGRSPSGQTLRSSVALAARGTWVFQATVLGERLDDQALDTFFQGWRFLP